MLEIPSLEQLRFRSLAETAAQALRDAIISGKLKPGERLIEQKLAADLGIGQPTLREALKELEYQGFVRKVPNKGTYVTKLSKDDFRKILEVRMALEILAIEQATRNITDARVQELEQILAAMENAAQQFDLATFHKSDVAFHRKIWSLAANEYLEVALERIVFALFAFVLLQRVATSTNEFLAATEQHRLILGGLRSGDPRQASQAFVRSTLGFWNSYHQVGLVEELIPALSAPESQSSGESI